MNCNTTHYRANSSSVPGDPTSAAYAKSRQQFGRPIASFGLVAKKLAEMAIATFVGETIGYRTTGLIDEAIARAKDDSGKVDAIEEFTVEASIIKVFGSEALDFCADECVQIHGGYGFIEEFQAERMLRDSRINRIFEGTNEINRLIVPGTILKRAAKGELPLLAIAGNVRSKTAKGEVPKAGEGELAVPQLIAERSKWLVLYVLSVAVETYQMRVADQQEVLGEIADMISAAYALDSVVARAQQVIADPKASAADKDFVRDVLTAYMPTGHGQVVQGARRVLMDILDDKGLAEHFGATETLRFIGTSKILEAKRRIAARVLERDGYPG